ncbi:NAD-dependent epimerase/dehydratase family protein [soil metagenome]
MNVAIVTGSSGLIGSEVCRLCAPKFDVLVGIDNDMRRVFFGDEASTAWNRERLERELGARYHHHGADIRDASTMMKIFEMYGSDIRFVAHCAAQPSHDWAAIDPVTDFTINANGTMNVLEGARRHAAGATIIHVSTNKVYGDRPNTLPLIEGETRWEVDPSHPFAAHGIDESMSIDACTHSLFGVSKTAGDLMAQEYARYFGLKTGIFRAGCLTGPSHSGAQLHGFLSYLMLATLTGRHYTINGYKGKQVRDNIHSHDLVNAFLEFHKNPRPGTVYNIGGGVHSNCSLLEAVALCEKISGKKLPSSYTDHNRLGDHIWYVSDVRRFQRDYPDWKYEYSLEQTLREIHDAMAERIASGKS